MATYAIGDVQGCFDELTALLSKIKYRSDCDQLWFCGDLVNRGPKSLETLRFVKSLEENAISVLGNHDLHLLATVFDHQQPGRKDTFDALLKADDATPLFEWLLHQRLAYHDESLNVTMLHAGIHPQWTIKQTMGYANEVENVLQSEHHINYFKHMYGDKPRHWDNSLTGWSRYRYITNMLTRLRYCDAQGKPSYSQKGAPGTQPDSLFPWYEVPDRISQHDDIIFGHWSTLPHAGLSSVNNAYAIDSGCLWGGALTAIKIDEKPYQYLRLDCPGAQKPPKQYLPDTTS